MSIKNRLACDHWVHSADFEVNIESQDHKNNTTISLTGFEIGGLHT